MAVSDFVKASNVKRVFSIDWRKNVVQAWGREREYAINDIVRAPTGTGFYYKCTVAGLSGGAVPDWKREADVLMSDGSVTWQVKTPAASGLFTISVSTWTVDAGITVGVKSILGYLTRIELDDGVDGQQYRAINDITLSTGLEFQDSIIVGIDDPDPL